MTLFDLFFLALLFAAVATLCAVAWLALQKHFVRSRRILKGLLLCFCIYMAVVIAWSLFSPRRILKAGAPRCFDDWCISVAGVKRLPQNGETAYSIDLRLSSRALRVRQRERNLSVYLTDNRGRRYDSIPDSSATPFDVALLPGESLTVSRSFLVPAGAKDVGLVITHEGGFPIRWFIIGYDTWFRKPPVLQLY